MPAGGSEHQHGRPLAATDLGLGYAHRLLHGFQLDALPLAVELVERSDGVRADPLGQRSEDHRRDDGQSDR